MHNQLRTTDNKSTSNQPSTYRSHTFGSLLSLFDTPHYNLLQDMEPKIEVSENKTNVLVTAELPGINEEDIDLEISANGYLTINGEKKHETTEAYQGSYFSEITYGHVSRTIPLPWDLEYTKAAAEYNNGILTVSIPKTVQEKAKKQKIAVSKSSKISKK